MEPQIKNLEALLNLDGKIKSSSVKNLTAPGENYGSQMLSLEVELNDGGKLNLVAKLVPPSDFMKKVFNTQVTFKKEVCFYSEYIPALRNFQKERGCEKVIDFVPKYYGARINLSGGDEVDDDACLVLENIKLKGYGLEDRFKGFDFETAGMLMKDLATLHAVGVGFKLTHPEGFKRISKPFLAQNFDEVSMPPEVSSGFIEALLKCVGENEKCLPHLNKLKNALYETAKYFKSKTDESEDDIFATIIHNDLWVNNTMILKNAKGAPVKNSFLDFQLTSYGNPAHDIVFFIYSSLSEDIIKNHYDTLLKTYHETFLETLASLRMDTSEFTFEKLRGKIREAATKMQVFHVLFMLKPILIEKDKTKELKDENEESLLDLDGVSDLFKSKVCFTILDFVERGWI